MVLKLKVFVPCFLVPLITLSEVESRTQGSRPRTQKKPEAKDSLSENRPSRGQGQECSTPRPRTKDAGASLLQKKRVFKKNRCDHNFSLQKKKARKLNGRLTTENIAYISITNVLNPPCSPVVSCLLI